MEVTCIEAIVLGGGGLRHTGSDEDRRSPTKMDNE